MFPPGLEPGTFRVLGERDNHYTTETLGPSGRVRIIIRGLRVVPGWIKIDQNGQTSD